ncbi:GGDEF domain-containing protein [Geomesophilobacter sediminis]|nr:GGDEF domain-containing protein [Geomesophilobacter sediminis]
MSLRQIPLLSPVQRELVFLSPYLALAVGLGLSLAFNRGRVFFALLLLGLFHLVTRHYLLIGATGYTPSAIYHCFCFLLPINLLLLSFMAERGIFTHAGRLRMSFIAIQLIAVYWIVRFRVDYSAVPELLSHPIVKSPFLEGLGLPQPAVVLFVVAGVLIAVRVLKRCSPIEVALFGTLIAIGISCDRIAADFTPTLFTAAAAVLLSIGVLQDSHSMAFTDELTALPSRRALNEQIMGLGRRYVVAMIDVDHFKGFNDTYGHDVGDQVLKLVGAKIRLTKGGGKAYRYGGEEFTIIFPGKTVGEVLPHLEELRETIQDYQLKLRGKDRPQEEETGRKRRSEAGGSAETVSVTVSIGVAASGDQRTAPEEALRMADKALYQAKKRGRNQVAVHR